MRRKDNEEIKKISWLYILSEMKNSAQDVLDFITTIAAPRVKQGGQQVPPICMTYALMIHTRLRELSLCQKVVTVILGVGHATKKNHRNFDMHWIAHYATYDRFSTHELDDSKPLHNLKNFDNANYLLSKEDMAKMKSDYIVLVARVLVRFFRCMEPINRAIPKHIQHKYSKEMAEKSEIVMLPVVPFNQNKHSDVRQYLEWLQKLLVEVR